ncbi:hypothetical protein [Streptomyces xantholiticus]
MAAVRGRLGVELPMRDLPRAPTVAGMSALVGEVRALAGMGNGPESETDEAFVQAALRGIGVAAYKVPDQLEVLEAMPLTGVGKVDKRALRADLGG